MLKRFRGTAAAAAVTAALALSVLPATPAAAQDCKIMGGGNYIAEVVDCVHWILITTIDDPDLPPHV
jgi:hypothetical protein